MTAPYTSLLLPKLLSYAFAPCELKLIIVFFLEGSLTAPRTYLLFPRLPSYAFAPFEL
ncbi:hypothetical protein KDK_82290 [Dictyobacter kobayashii]|uniref:Uncharacterized protein n=1 Tax=Dictyobacter kobayashii TaxID=2014872 RepID=A0A402AZ93_9CHLR|nr:hypothetical protein KDK_82290 [Dictyobacter kobayashii]